MMTLTASTTNECIGWQVIEAKRYTSVALRIQKYYAVRHPSIPKEVNCSWNQGVVVLVELAPGLL